MINLRMFAAAALIALIAAGISIAQAQTTIATSKSQCSRQNGALVCTAKLETAHSTTTTVCASRGGGTSCTTSSGEPRPAQLPRTFYLEADARTKHTRESTGYKDPGASNLCPPPHYRMTERDGCQPR